MALPTVRLGTLEVTRLIIGGNPFSGFSHQSAELNEEMRDYYTVARIKQTLNEAAEAGINTFVGRADNHIQRLLREYWQEGGLVKQWIAQTAPERASQLDNIDQAAGSGAAAIYIHGGVTDRKFAEGKLEELRPWLERIKEHGLPAGMASHQPDVHLAAEELGLPTDFYVQCFYNIFQRGENYLAEDREKNTETIRKLPKPVIGYKILAAGRNDPEEAFAYAFSHIKPKDAVCVGVYTKHKPNMIAELVELTLKYSPLSPSS